MFDWFKPKYPEPKKIYPRKCKYVLEYDEIYDEVGFYKYEWDGVMFNKTECLETFTGKFCRYKVKDDDSYPAFRCKFVEAMRKVANNINVSDSEIESK